MMPAWECRVPRQRTLTVEPPRLLSPPMILMAPAARSAFLAPTHPREEATQRMSFRVVVRLDLFCVGLVSFMSFRVVVRLDLFCVGLVSFMAVFGAVSGTVLRPPGFWVALCTSGSVDFLAFVMVPLPLQAPGARKCKGSACEGDVEEGE